MPKSKKKLRYYTKELIYSYELTKLIQGKSNPKILVRIR